MARGKKRTLEEEVADLNRRASESQEKLMMTKLQKALKLRPSMILPCWEKVLALGYVEDDAVGAESSGVPVSKQKQAKLQRGASMKGESVGQCADIPDPMNKNWTLLSHVTIPFIQTHLLPSLEPSALSAPNLRCHEKHIGKAELLQIVEFLTGLADWELSGPHRSKSVFIKFLQERYAIRGRRGGLLVLPVAWEKQGLYVIDAVSDEEVKVRSQYTDSSVCIKLSTHHVGHSDQLYVDSNFSEARAALRVRCKPQIPEVSLQSFFGSSEFITPEKQKVKTGMASPSMAGSVGLSDGALARDGEKVENRLHAVAA
eukprot:6179054-Amphidinium_carterae.1